MNAEKIYADTVPEFPANDNTPQPFIRHMGATRPVITVDVSLYEQYLAECDLTEEEKHDFLQTVWKIFCEFIMYGYGVHPLQQVENGCGRTSGNDDHGSFLTLDMLELEDHQVTEKFKDVAEPKKSRRKKESQYGTSL